MRYIHTQNQGGNFVYQWNVVRVLYSQQRIDASKLRIYLQKYIGEILVTDLDWADALCVDPFFSEAYLLPGTIDIRSFPFWQNTEDKMRRIWKF
jgi:hypothetical protein